MLGKPWTGIHRKYPCTHEGAPNFRPSPRHGVPMSGTDGDSGGVCLVRRFSLIAAFSLGLALAFILGPRIDLDATIDTVQVPDAPGELDAWLAAKEAAVPNVMEGTEKTIVWNGVTGERTPLSVVYLHGWSASRQETRPFADSVAARLGANLYYTRLEGHGRDGDAMAEATLDQLAVDAAEAMEIGRRLGDRVILIGTSTGGTLATWIAARSETRRDLAGMVLISPNFAPKDGRAEIMLWPWGRTILRMVQGDSLSWTPENELHAQYWTTQYPSEALLPMMGFVKITRDADLESVDVPAIVFYSMDDGVINPDLIPEHVGRFSGPVELVEVEDSGDPKNHVLAGDILSPGTTDRLSQQAASFISEHVR